MNVLAVDTATENCSCALLHGTSITQRCELAPQQHAKLLLSMIDGLLADSQVSRKSLDAIVFGQGPGSFTGLRIAASAAQGIALALDIPVLGISTLQAMAHKRFRLDGVVHTLAAIDARMAEVYWGAYLTSEPGISMLVGEERVTAASEVIEPVPQALALTPDMVKIVDTSGFKDTEWTLAGTGLTVCLAEDQHVLAARSSSSDANLLPEAHDMLLLAEPRLQQGEGVAAEKALPVYLRNKVAETMAERAEKANRNV